MIRNLNIIRLVFLFVFITSISSASCPKCKMWYKSILVKAAEDIDSKHEDLEDDISEYHKENIQPLLDDIKKLENDITTINVRMVHLEKEANIHDKKLLHVLRKNIELNIMGNGDLLK